MFERLEYMEKRYEELERLISDPDVVARREEWQRLCKEHAAMEEVIGVYRSYLKACKEMEDCKDMMNGDEADIKEIAEAEYYDLKDKCEEYVRQMKILLLPKDPMDEKNVIIEIRGGAGGDEAALFATELARMYHRFAERMRWKMEDIDVSETELGGIKEATYMIKGQGAYSKLKYESGVHRVQRVPETESQGRVHTSTATVAVLPEADEVDFEINEKDLKIDTYRSGGAGGQNVNKVSSAVRITYLPLNLVVACQDERSQLKNKEKAMNVLKSRLYDYYQGQKDSEYAANRHMQIGTGDRSERIRTYNYPQGRVTDHRIGKTLYTLPAFLDGDIFEMIESLALADRDAKLSKLVD